MASRKLILFDGRKITIYRQSQFILPTFTVGKAPLQVDNSIKQGCNASLQGRFENKTKASKTLAGGICPKTGWLCFIAEAFSGKTGGAKTFTGLIFSKTRGALRYCRGVLLHCRGVLLRCRGSMLLYKGAMCSCRETICPKYR